MVGGWGTPAPICPQLMAECRLCQCQACLSPRRTHYTDEATEAGVCSQSHKPDVCPHTPTISTFSPHVNLRGPRVWASVWQNVPGGAPSLWGVAGH